MRNVIERKFVEKDKLLFTFITLRAVFVNVDRNKIRKCLEELKVTTEEIIIVIKSIYRKVKWKVLIAGGIYKQFKINKGPKQEDSLTVIDKIKKSTVEDKGARNCTY